MPHLFRSAPPLELIEQIVKMCGLRGLDDMTWFSKYSIRISEFEHLLPELEPYYLPCKAKEYLHSCLIPNRAITILRQVLKSRSIEMTFCEKARGGVKTTWYQLVVNPEKKEIRIEFN